MQNVYVLTLPRAFASGITGAKDLLSADEDFLHAVAGGVSGINLGFRVELVGRVAAVTTPFGLSIPVDRRLSDTEPADIVYIPPLALLPDQAAQFPPDLLDWLREQYAGGAMLCTACTGTLLLAATGLLDGIPATTHWAYDSTMRRFYPSVDLRINRTLVVAGDDQRLVTAGAQASWYDLVLYLIHRYSGAAAARKIAKFFLLDWHELDQNAYACFRENLRHSDEPIRAAQLWLSKNAAVAEPIDKAMAESGLPSRSFQRRFRKATGHTPLDYVQRLRVESAKNLLECSDASVEDITCQVGYEDVTYFRRLFRRVTGLTPAAYRKAFRTPPNIAALLPSRATLQ